MELIDLHVHTNASDGALSPSDTVNLAAGKNLAAIAITDHDAINGYCEIADTYTGKLEIVPGIEFSSKYNGPVHILGYYLDPDNSGLKAALKSIVDDRDRRNEQIVKNMQEDGISITYDEMKNRFGNVVGRPHFALILLENGMVSSITEAFERYVGKGMRYWYPRTTLDLETCINLISGAGGIPVLAHPFEYSYKNKTLAELLGVCIRAGIRGIECRHSSHTPGQMMYLEAIADEYGLLKTGGSDFHGTIKPDISLGSGKGEIIVPYSWLENLKKAIKK